MGDLVPSVGTLECCHVRHHNLVLIPIASPIVLREEERRGEKRRGEERKGEKQEKSNKKLVKYDEGWNFRV